MAHLYHITSRICESPSKEPSNLGSGLGEEEVSVSFSGKISADEMPAVHAGNPGPEPKTKVKVIIIGAGIAGLRAASVLQRHGVEVVVLEGRDRLGGRIHTTRNDRGVPRDIGAAWLHETSQNRLVKLISSLKLDYYYDDGLPLYYTEQGRAGAQFKAKKVADEFADHCEWFYETHPDAPDQSVSDFINKFVQEHELITNDEKMWAPMAVKEVELWLGTSTELSSSKHLSYFITERNLYMKGGYDNIVKWTADSLKPNTIELNQIVDRICWDDKQKPCERKKTCAVECHDIHGEVSTFKGDAVISTLPLGVLRHGLVAFEPSLPDDLQRALTKFSYGALDKVFFEFADVFWSKDNDQFMYYPTPPLAAEDLYSTSAGSGS
ncbi:hypothetical protein TI39_contig500g00001 [Zymoseptoria brevis]|uniref:Amine oxidase domain-containing protein n=1 Tax=Zymoseptoria brevis TaxID=1047168 RepID=A0A0F4GJX1_9PEZI|nr:hypothetical protein TI39_contig500g00001 [Zymoseptoria brevis]